MPRIHDQLLDSVFYVYNSPEDAENGIGAGATGFLVSVSSNVDISRSYVYAVTNRHVVKDDRVVTLRFNSHDSKRVIIPTVSSVWVRHPDGDDVAVFPINGLYFPMLKCCGLGVNMFLTSEIISKHNIGPGDDVYMIGRFIAHDGKQRNSPSVRFGNISMMPSEKIPHPGIPGHEQESFLIETRSLNGFSGSPVFIRIDNASYRPENEGVIPIRGLVGQWLLGIDWGHLPIYEKVIDKSDKIKDLTVKSNSGQMAVVPAWKIHDLLFGGEIFERRNQSEADLANSIK